MYCEKCGVKMNPESGFCSNCGARAPQQQVPVQPNYYQHPPVQQPNYQQPYYQQPVQVYPSVLVSAPENLSWKDFYGRYVSKKTKNIVTWMAVIYFFTAVVSIALLGMLGDMDLAPYTLMDVSVYVLMGVLLLTTKHWVFALVPTIYGAIFTVIGMANDGTTNGIFAVVYGVLCISVLMKAGKAYKKYQTERVLPEGEI